MTDSPKKHLNFPRIRNIRLQRFTLYLLAPTLTISVKEGALCIVGANGLGKSTFLNAANFALTGIVPKPDREFNSTAEFHHLNQQFATQYFDGRIEEKDHNLAEITIEFDLNSNKYLVTRGFFEVNQLRSLSITSLNDKAINTYENISPEELNTEYIKSMTKDIGVASFDQFVFLQLFVFTFDERHELLFWNNKVIEQALYLAFGIDPAQAKQADTLRRDSEKAGSLARNYSWRASEIREQINNLQRETIVAVPEDISIEFKRLTKLQSEQQENVKFLQDALENARTQQHRASSQLAHLRSQYEQEFQSHLHVAHDPLRHPILIQSIQSSVCSICGTEKASVKTLIQSKIDRRECPLCETHINNLVQNPNIDLLKALDANLEKARMETEEHTNTVNRISKELKAASEELQKINNNVNGFESANQSILANLQNKQGVIEGIAAIQVSYQHQMEDLLLKKNEQYKRRDQKRTELAKLQKDLERSYIEAETNFVPLFKDLAFQFLGIDLAINLHTTTPTNPSITLALEVRGSTRKQQFQLSESQRFFVDIALRMALARYMATENSKATLYIDTPEGSLDIAYESRAGSMFAIFIENGHDIFMTANINSSQLVLQLAKRCGEQKMQVMRMTEWAELSEVQIEEESLFENAYSRIDNALHKRIIG